MLEYLKVLFMIVSGCSLIINNVLYVFMIVFSFLNLIFVVFRNLGFLLC